MADEATDALIPEAPSTEDAAPQQEAPAPDPYQKRYEDLRPQWDRTNTLLDRARQGDLEAIRELNLPYEEPEDAEPEVEYDDPYAARLAEQDKRLSEFEQWKQQQEQAALAEVVSKHVDTLAADKDLSLTDDDKQYIISRAAQNGINRDSTEAAFAAHVSYLENKLEAERENWIESKKAPRVGTGQAASKQPDLDNDQERRAWMKAQLGL